MKLGIILGTRPEIIKLSPIIRECENRGLEYFLLHTNQHYSPKLDKVFFDELNLPQPKYNLGVSSESKHGAMVGKMLIGIEPILEKEQPDWVLVEGDTNTVLAGVLAASKLGIKVGHIEAGLRSYDRTMPEELNRIVADHLADALFCPTTTSAKIVRGEGISKDRIFVTGNTIVDAVQQNLELAHQSNLAQKYLEQKYLLLTMHRPSNVDTQEALSRAINSLETLVDELKIPIIFPIHPRTTTAIKRFHLTTDPAKIKLIDPVGYLEMLLLMENAQLILTDSGGIQEEACILHVPCVTLRDNTERPETVKVGANLVSGTNQARVISAATQMLVSERDWPNPFGRGSSARQIINNIIT